jgi:hypothetical protein
VVKNAERIHIPNLDPKFVRDRNPENDVRITSDHVAAPNAWVSGIMIGAVAIAALSNSPSGKNG